MAASSVSVTLPNEEHRILIVNLNLEQLRWLFDHFQTAALAHAEHPDGVRKRLDEFKPEIVACAGKLFQSLIATPRKLGAKLARLSPRQREIAELATKGFTNRQIAEALDLSERVVKAEIAALRILMQAGNWTELAGSLAID